MVLIYRSGVLHNRHSFPTRRSSDLDNYRTNLGPSDKFAHEGFIFAYQDVRGKGRSEGQFVHVRPHNPQKKSSKEIDESSDTYRSEEHTSELQSRLHLVCRLLLEKKK